MDGKELIGTAEFANKVSRAVETSRQISNGSFIICARTDARGVYGIEEVIVRSKAYIAAGADMIFPEGLTSEEEFAFVAKELRNYKKDVFLLANMTEFGKTPNIALSKFASLGFNCVIYPVSTLRVSMKAVEDMLDELKDTETLQGQIPKMQTRQRLYETLEYTPGIEWHFPNSTKHKQNN